MSYLYQDRDSGSLTAERVLCSDADWSHASVAELTEHIVSVHHRYLHEHMPRLSTLIYEVATLHGHNHDELHEVRMVFETMRADIDAHMIKEETMLFPHCKELEGITDLPTYGFETARRPIRAIEWEHDTAGMDLSRIRRLTNDFTPPDDADDRYREMLAGLAELEDDVLRHIAEENDLLFPRVLALERSVRPAG